MKEIEVKVAVGGETFRANRSADGSISIDKWNANGSFWEWAGNGKWTSCIEDCAADIGDAAYAAIDDAITEAE